MNSFSLRYQSTTHRSTAIHCIVQPLLYCIVCSFLSTFFFPKVPPTTTLLVSSAETKVSGDGVKMIFVYENSSTSFTCVSIGSRPGSRISWNLGNMEIKPKYITYMNDVDEGLYDTESTIRIRPQKNNHKQSIQCSTSLGIAVIHRRKATLIVYG